MPTTVATPRAGLRPARPQTFATHFPRHVPGRRDPRTLRYGLDDEALRRWHRDGLLILRGVFDRAEMEEVRELQERIFAERAELLDPDNLRFEWVERDGSPTPWKIDPFWDLDPRFGDLVRDPRICDPLRSIYEGFAPRLFKDKYIIKPPGSHGSGIHQDYNWWQGFPTSCLSVAVAVDAADETNGCTRFWPGSHRRGFLHQPGSQSGLMDRSDLEVDPIELVTEPGDIAIFHCFTLHAAGANESDRPRRQLFLSYNSAEDGEHYQAHREHFLAYRTDRQPGQVPDGAYFM